MTREQGGTFQPTMSNLEFAKPWTQFVTPFVNEDEARYEYHKTLYENRHQLVNDFHCNKCGETIASCTCTLTEYIRWRTKIEENPVNEILAEILVNLHLCAISGTWNEKPLPHIKHLIDKLTETHYKQGYLDGFGHGVNHQLNQP